MKAERNKASEEIAQLKRSGQDATAILARMKEVSDRSSATTSAVTELDERLKNFLLTGAEYSALQRARWESSAADNIEVRRWGRAAEIRFQTQGRIAKSAKAREFSISNRPSRLPARVSRCTSAWARGSNAPSPISSSIPTRASTATPKFCRRFIVNTASLTGVGQLPKFAADMFHLESTDLWLTPDVRSRAHQPASRRNPRRRRLPIKVCAWTACFRSEAGAAGKDTRGIKRQHQFQKVEMFKFTPGRTSYDELESLVRNAEAVLQKLGLHYRVVQLCTADMGFAAAKTYDIEVWLPSAGEFMEISSCSNTEAFQARRSGIRFKPKSGKSEFVHTLNGSGLAVGRTWIAHGRKFPASRRLRSDARSSAPLHGRTTNSSIGK